MDVKADRVATQIAAISDASSVDATLIPAIINHLNQYPRSTRTAIVAFATELASVSQS
jgi:hypothetical protein